ncbi:DUF6443 domain-containing protein [Flavobacterium sp. FlaQc-52]|uniref:DUF6443 domain-containing protein n=1 Tax=Flavobacterium sp. FlaQc-52 TaxID=3374185 RepID=UPI003756F592
MRKILYILLLLPLHVISQTTTQNFVKNATYKDPVTTTDETKANIIVTYFDGLGRAIQQVNGKASGTGKDIVRHIEYDGYGRQSMEYLPYASGNNNLLFDTSAEANTLSFYNTAAFENTPNPYNQTFFEVSPLNRAKKQAAPGNIWIGNTDDDNDHTIKYAYLTGVAAKLTANAQWSPTTKQYEPTFVNNGSYTEGELYKTITQDENKTGTINLENTTSNFNTIEEYTNKEGQVVLKKTYNTYVNKQFGTSSYAAITTNYVYDQFGNLSYVLPPSSFGIYDANNCYSYKYDGKNRLTEKKLPGKKWEYIIYDGSDRVIASGPVYSPFGTGEEGWIYNIYDVYGRLCISGWYPMANITSTSRKVLQDNNISTMSVTRYNKTGSSTIDTISTDYILPTGFVLPTGFKLLKLNYYDNYKFTGSPGEPPFTDIEGQGVANTVTGLPTGSWNRVPTTATETFNEITYFIYDAKGRVIKNRLTNYLGGYTQTTNKLDFDGTPIYTITSHRKTALESIVSTREEFTYTQQDRLLSHTHKIGSGTAQLMTHNSYNELGQLTRKNVGGTDATGIAALQKIDYSYNIRGWLTGINNVRDLALPNDPQDLFALSINYTDSPSQSINGEVQALYNGNIAEISWRTPSDNIRRSYGFTYDKLSQLTASWYQIPQASVPVRNSYNEKIYYDLNGNIKNLERNGESDTSTSVIEIDDLVYSYDTVITDRLMKVTDTSNHSKGFKDSPDNAVSDYSYDTYGNLKTDRNKGITSIIYNHLNLPIEIIFNNSATLKIKYTYNTSGTKVKKEVTNGATITTTDYLTGFQYTDGVLDFYQTAEGYVKVTWGDMAPSGGIHTYVFNYKDHLGNNRLSYVKDPSDGVLKIMEENHYYPLGLKHNGYSAGQNIMREFQVAPFVVLTPVINSVDATYKYKYNNKELQDESIGGVQLNLYDFGARNYDVALGRWMNIDPLAEMSRKFSPYVYALNNPVYFIDPDGMAAAPSSSGGTSPENFTSKDISFNVNVGNGIMREINSVGASASFSNGTLGLTNSGEEKVHNDAKFYLNQQDYTPDQKITEVEKKNSYAWNMRQSVLPLYLLYNDAGNPDIEYEYTIPGAHADYGHDGKHKVRVSQDSFQTNFTLFIDLIHEGMHAWDNHHGLYDVWGGWWSKANLGDYGVVRSTTEVRAYQIERWFGGPIRNDYLFKQYMSVADKHFSNYQIKSFPVFFENIRNKK